MSTATRTKPSKLTPHEAEQVRRIAAWKSQPVNALSELWKRISLPAARALEKVIPDRLVRAAIDKSYDASDLIAGQEAIKRLAGVRDLSELRSRPLEQCDALAIRIGASSQTLAAVEGAATGAGGIFTTLLDIPLLFILALAAIRRIGHCYGYPLEHKRDRNYVLGVLLAATAGSLEIRRVRIDQLHQLEDMLIVEAQEDLLAQEALSFLFQLEVFEDVPGIGALSGAALNWTFMRRVDETARVVFQERWLRDNGRVERIEPAEVHALHLAGGWSGALNRAAYSGCYYLGFGVTLPVYAFASMLRPMDNALVRGLRDGVAAANERAEKATAWARGAVSPSVNARDVTPALVSS